MQKLKAKHYIRYADDFIILSQDKDFLERTVLILELCLKERFALELHPNKVFIKTPASGVDFLGWIHFPDRRVLRTATKRRMLKRIKDNSKPESINSYLGLLGHGNAYKLKEII